MSESKPSSRPTTNVRRPSGSIVQGGRQPTQQHPKPSGPVNIGKPITPGGGKQK
jgi:hypothetical protein